MFNVWDLVLKFLVGQIAKFGAAFNWAKFKVGVHAFLAPLPDFIEGALVELADQAIDVLSCALQDQADMKAVLEAVAIQNWVGAVAAIKLLLEKCAHPHAAKMLAEVKWDLPAAA